MAQGLKNRALSAMGTFKKMLCPSVHESFEGDEMKISEFNDSSTDAIFLKKRLNLVWKAPGRRMLGIKNPDARN